MNAIDKERVLTEIVHRVVEPFATDLHRIETAIFDTLYEERKRLEAEPPQKSTQKQLRIYDEIQTEALHGGPSQHKRLLARLVRIFAEEVAGHFNPTVYAIATRIAPTGLSVLLNTLSPMKVLEGLPNGFSELQEQLQLDGDIEAVKSLGELGTTIIVPTHASHLDSIVMGYALYRLGRPPHLYGAGLNLFSNRLVGHFLSNLGAYKVDRKKKSDLYKEVLRNYAGCTLELGYNNLFFPGGTRSRSGAVESHLKLGLLSMGLSAYLHNLAENKARPDIFIVPCTVNYELVLEAETLIDDYLKEAGKSRYVIDDDEFSRPQRVLEFAKKLFSLDSRIHVVFGQALDVFGNPVNRNGISMDPRGRSIDRKRYLFQNGAVVQNKQRDEEFTRQLADTIAADYRRNTVIKTTHLVCHVVFDLLEKSSPTLDLYHLLRFGGSVESFHLPEIYNRIEHDQVQLRNLRDQGKLRLDPAAEQDPVDILNHAILHLNSYHRKPVILRQGDRLFHHDRNLLLYYRNRLSSIGWPHNLEAK